MPQLIIDKIHQLQGHRAAIYAIAPSPTPNHFLSAGGDGWLVEWDFANPDPGKVVAQVQAKIFAFCTLPDPHQLLVGDMDGGVHWVHRGQAEKGLDIAHHRKGVFGFFQIGEWVYSLGGAGKLTRWSVAERRAVDSIQLSGQSLRAVAYHPAQQLLAIGSSDQNIYLFHEPSLEIQHVIHQAHDNSVFSLAFSPDGQHLLSGGRDAMLKAWDVPHGYETILSVPAHLFTINDICFHPKGHLFATASRDKTLKIWDASKLKLLKVIEGVRDGGHVNSVNCLHWSTYNNWLISAGDDRSVIIWDIQMNT